MQSLGIEMVKIDNKEVWTHKNNEKKEKLILLNDKSHVVGKTRMAFVMYLFIFFNSVT